MINDLPLDLYWKDSTVYIGASNYKTGSSLYSIFLKDNQKLVVWHPSEIL